MNIAFYGSSLLSAYWNGAATYYRGILKELGGRGHDITFFEPDAFERQLGGVADDARRSTQTNPGFLRLLDVDRLGGRLGGRRRLRAGTRDRADPDDRHRRDARTFEDSHMTSAADVRCVTRDRPAAMAEGVAYRLAFAGDEAPR